jgi:hypothetical protein
MKISNSLYLKQNIRYGIGATTKYSRGVLGFEGLENDQNVESVVR